MEYHCYVFNRFSHLACVFELTAEHDIDACVRAEEVAMGAADEELHRVELWQGDRRVYSLDMLQPRGNA
jgi:hypothetical protein